MARITVEDCVDKFESRFELVLVAANRARKIHSGESPTVEKDNDKNTVIALREIAEETIHVDELKEKLVEEYQTVSMQSEEELSLEYSSDEAEHGINTDEDITEKKHEETNEINNLIQEEEEKKEEENSLLQSEHDSNDDSSNDNQDDDQLDNLNQNIEEETN